MLGAVKRSLLRRLPRVWVGRLRSWRVRYIIKTFPARVVEHSYAGCRLKVFLADPLSQGWYDQDWAIIPEVVELRKNRLRLGARVFDIGAHQGVVAAILANEVGPSGQVIAVEASPHNCRVVAKNCELNGLLQIEVLFTVIADRPRKIIFNERLNGQIDDGSGSDGRLLLDAVTLNPNPFENTTLLNRVLGGSKSYPENSLEPRSSAAMLPYKPLVSGGFGFRWARGAIRSAGRGIPRRRGGGTTR